MKTIINKVKIFLLAAVCLLALQGCLLTKIVTVPMRVTGAVISIVPVVGNPAHDTIDEAARIVDKVQI